MKIKLTASTLLLCLSFPAAAIVNVEGMRVGDTKQGFKGNLNISVSGKNGNTEKQDVGVDSRLQWKKEKTTDFVVISYDHGESSGIRNTNKAFIHGRHVVQFQPKRAWEFFEQAERNEFSRLSLRALIGGGLRFTLAEEKDRIGLYLGTGAFYSRETLDKRTGLTDDGTEKFSRGNLYLSYKHKLNEQLSLISTTYYQPRLSDSSDFRAMEQAALAIKMTEQMSFKLSLDMAYDSHPPQSVEKSDIAYRTGLSYQF